MCMMKCSVLFYLTGGREDEKIKASSPHLGPWSLKGGYGNLEHSAQSRF